MSLGFQSIVYLLCFIISLACAWLLARGYIASRTRLLFWSSLCFAFLALNNLLVVADIMIFPNANLSLWRQLAGLVAVGVLLFGFVWESE